MPSTSQRISVVTASSDLYSMPLGVTFRSALDSLGETWGLDLYVIDGGITDENKDRLLRTWNDPRLRVTWLHPDMSPLEGLEAKEYFTKLTYARLLMPALIPPSVDRVLYLDSDLLILRDLAELWAEPVEGLGCRAVLDSAIPWLDPRRMLPHYAHCKPYLAATAPVPNFRELGLDPTAPYFNAGVLSVNLRYWREHEITRQALDCLHTHRQHVKWCDQYALNVVMHQHWLPLDSRWNQQAHIYVYPQAEACPFDAATVSNLKYDPWIVHFTSARKPWHFECDHPFLDRFFGVLDQTAWRGWRPEKPYRNLVQWLQYQYQHQSNVYRKWSKRRKHRVRAQQASPAASALPAQRVVTSSHSTPNYRSEGDLVSVIIPIDRGARFIAGALATVAGQSWPQWEVLVVEDDSQGDAAAMVRRFAAEHPEHRIECLRHARNHSFGAARNTGIAAARGQFIAFLDVDDRWQSSHLTASLSALRQEKADLAYSTVALLDDQSELIFATWGPTGKELDCFPASLMDRSFVAPSAAVFRRELIDRVGLFDPELSPCEHVDYCIRAAAAGAWFSHVKGCHVLYRKNHGAAKFRNACRLNESFARVLDKHVETFGQNQRRYRELAARAYFGAAWRHLSTRRDQDPTADPSRAPALLRRAAEIHHTKLRYRWHDLVFRACHALHSDVLRRLCYAWLRPWALRRRYQMRSLLAR